MSASISVLRSDNLFSFPTSVEESLKELNETSLLSFSKRALFICATPRKLSMLLPVKSKSKSPERMSFCFVRPIALKSIFSAFALRVNNGFFLFRLS